MIRPLTPRLLGRLLWLSGVPWLLRHTLQRRRVTILLWHDPSPAAFSRHLSALRRRYNLVALDDAVAAVAAGDLAQLPPKPLVVTFDDGHLGNVDLLPVFRTIRGMATLFVCAVIGSTRTLWFKHVAAPGAFRRLPDRERRRRLEEVFQNDARGTPDTVSPEQLAMLAEICDVQAHTVSHPYLPACDDATVADELIGSKRWLEREFGLRVTTISYPNGDYSERDIHFARQAGYASAITVDPGFNRAGQDIYRLRRICVGDGDPTALLLVKASGLWDLIKVALRRRPSNGFFASPWFDEDPAPLASEADDFPT
jgi:peptidoglycan/xylan/chitin deacetylase (PgdA/CDA1 family)